ncbi:autotransporter domain-containing protein [Sinirhodobacter sp. WL0062]|uniref:Autotransporter domain-containing protein n=1 Tax=Rhodobacter flavimaris TaxID=2907145 RepID=A0ABS8YX82_9RHOB|nr:autotransporter domain-containing protein [Sinirhodobacter sp. WL0062]
MNTAPTANAGTDFSVASGASSGLNGSGSSDPEDDTLSYSWTQTSGTSVSLSGATTATPSFTAPTLLWSDSPATLVFKLTVSDGEFSSEASVTVTVNPPARPNTAPTADAGTDFSVASGASSGLNGSGSSDPEDDTLSYSWTQTSGTTVSLSGATTATPSFTAPTLLWSDSPATLVFKLTVSDGEFSSEASVTVTVNPPANTVPTASAGTSQSVASGASVNLSGGGSDPDVGQTLSYTWTQASGTTVSLSGADTTTPSFTAPVLMWSDSAEDLVFELVVYDGYAYSTASSVTVTVNPPANTAPTANAGDDQFVESGAGVLLDGRGSSDPENDPLSYAWTQTGGPTVTLSSASTAQPGFTAPDVAMNDPVAELTFQLIVSDDQGNDSAPDTVVITVAPAKFDDGIAQQAFGEATEQFIERRIERLMANEPSAYLLDRRRNAENNPRFSITPSETSGVRFSASNVSEDRDWYVWSEGIWSVYEDESGSYGTRDGEFGLISFGADFLASERLSLGLMAQFDSSDETAADAFDISGKGWLFGPYLSTELSRNLFMSARLSWGQSSNDAALDVFGQGDIYTGEFDTSRFYSTVSLYGKYQAGEAVLTPLLKLQHLRESMDAFSISGPEGATEVPNGVSKRTRLSASTEWEYPISQTGSGWAVFVEPELNWTRTTSTSSEDRNEVAGAVEIGARTLPGADWSGEVSLRYDGFGGDDTLEAMTLRSLLQLRF